MARVPPSPTRTAGPNTAWRRAPTMSSTPGGAIGWTRTPRTVGAGGRAGRQHGIRRASDRIGVGKAQSHAADVRLVRKALGVQLHGHRPAPECAPGGDGGVRVAGGLAPDDRDPRPHRGARGSRVPIAAGVGLPLRSSGRPGPAPGRRPRRCDRPPAGASHDGRALASAAPRAAAPPRPSRDGRERLDRAAEQRITRGIERRLHRGAHLAAREATYTGSSSGRSRVASISGRTTVSAVSTSLGSSRYGESCTSTSTSYAPDSASTSNAARYAGSGSSAPQGSSGLPM